MEYELQFGKHQGWITTSGSLGVTVYLSHPQHLCEQVLPAALPGVTSELRECSSVTPGSAEHPVGSSGPELPSHGAQAGLGQPPWNHRNFQPQRQSMAWPQWWRFLQFKSIICTGPAAWGNQGRSPGILTVAHGPWCTSQIIFPSWSLLECTKLGSVWIHCLNFNLILKETF